MYGLVENFAEEAIVIVKQVDPTADDKCASTTSDSSIDSSPLEELMRIATAIDGIDVECYSRHGQNSCKPIVGLNKVNAQWCFFGRDPGEQEVVFQKPFVGDAGQRIRAVMAKYGLSDDNVYWMNTVPFKPIQNKAWSVEIQRKCRPALLKLLAKWNGTMVITFGESAFKWFGLGSRKDRQIIEQFWLRADKYEAQLPITLNLNGVERSLILCPVPHPSGKNATWFSRFPVLLASRLQVSAD
jgi:uracil-DNA glycosylase family 4